MNHLDQVRERVQLHLAEPGDHVLLAHEQRLLSLELQIKRWQLVKSEFHIWFWIVTGFIFAGLAGWLLGSRSLV